MNRNTNHEIFKGLPPQPPLIGRPRLPQRAQSEAHVLNAHTETLAPGGFPAGAIAHPPPFPDQEVRVSGPPTVSTARLGRAERQPTKDKKQSCKSRLSVTKKCNKGGLKETTKALKNRLERIMASEEAIQEHDPQEKDPTSSTDSHANALDLRTTGTYSAKAAFTFFGKKYAEEAKRSVNNCKSRVANMFSDSEAFTDMLMDEDDEVEVPQLLHTTANTAQVQLTKNMASNLAQMNNLATCIGHSSTPTGQPLQVDVAVNTGLVPWVDHLGLEIGHMPQQDNTGLPRPVSPYGSEDGETPRTPSDIIRHEQCFLIQSYQQHAFSQDPQASTESQPETHPQVYAKREDCELIHQGLMGKYGPRFWGPKWTPGTILLPPVNTNNMVWGGSYPLDEHSVHRPILDLHCPLSVWNECGECPMTAKRAANFTVDWLLGVRSRLGSRQALVITGIGEGMNFGAVIKKLKSMKKARQVEDWVEQEDKGAVEVKLTKYLAYAEHPDSPGKLKALWSRARSTYM